MDLKYYQLGTHAAEQWCEVHRELIDNSGADSIPSKCVTCVDDKPHSPTRGIFLLTDEEADALKADPHATPTQLKSYLTNLSTSSVIYSTGLDNDYTDSRSLKGGNNRYLYNPLNSPIQLRIQNNE